MSTNAAFPPFEFIDDNGNFAGFDVDMARAIARIMGRELVIRDMEFTAALAAVTTGGADIAIAAITILPNRLETMDFSIPYFETTLVAIVPVDSAITTVDELNGKRIAVQFGTTSHALVEEILNDVSVTALNRAPDTILELINRRVDAIVVDQAVAELFIHDQPGLRILEEDLGLESYGIAMNKGSKLLGPINDALRQIKESGEYQEIWDRWFGGVEE
jgi:polar amino acid transport system substrate-binding protein